MPRELQDPQNAQLTATLEEMLAGNLSISKRAVARRMHPTFKSASDITRNERRKALVEEYEKRQATLRTLTARVAKTGTAAAAEKIQDLESRVKRYEENEAARVSSHLAMIHAVAELGGTAKLKKFYGKYAQIRDHLARECSLPSEHLDPPQ